MKTDRQSKISAIDIEANRQARELGFICCRTTQNPHPHLPNRRIMPRSHTHEGRDRPEKPEWPSRV